MPRSERMSALRILTTALLLVLPACAHGRNPSVGDESLRPGRYSFTGSVVGENQYANQVRRFHEPVFGTVQIRPDGSVDLTSTHGSCSNGRMQRGVANVACGDIRVRLTGTSGTVTLILEEEQEVRTNRCVASTPSPVGGQPAQCFRYETEIRLVRRARSSEVLVTREADGFSRQLSGPLSSVIGGPPPVHRHR